MRLSLLFAGLPLAVLACNRPLPGDDGGHLELRTYDVPKGTAQPLEKVVSDVFWTGDKAPSVGRATVTPDGRLAVIAPHNVQAGVADLVSHVRESPKVADTSIDMHYWLVLARPAPSPSPPPPGAQEVAAALAEIQRTSGPQSWSNVEHVELSSLSNEFGKVEAKDLKIHQTAARTEDGIVANVGIDLVHDPGRLETKVHLVPGQVVVLGATRPQGGDAGDSATLYYLVRVAPRSDEGNK